MGQCLTWSPHLNPIDTDKAQTEIQELRAGT